jgi:hypothetical protein
MMETVKAKKAKANKTDEELKSEALEFYRQLIERDLKPTIDGASIDFHRNKDLTVFVPGESPLIAVVKHEELLDFLKANSVNRVLVDALFPSRVPLLQSLLKHGIEVYMLRRPSALAGFKAMLERRYNKKKNKGKQDVNNNDNNGIKIPRKNDFVDAVALAFTWPKFHRRLDWRFLECWRAMNRWRRSYMLYHKVQQMLSEDEDELPVVTLHEDRLIKKAKMFVDKVERHFPGIRRVFEEVRIPPDDVIAQALCCEVVLEVYHIPKKSDVLEKAGIRYSPTPKKTRPKKKEEASEDESKPKYIHDGKLLYAVTQLTVKLYHLNPRSKKDQRKIRWKAPKLLRRIWRSSRELLVTKEDGRVGEASGVSGPSHKGGLRRLNPVLLGALQKQGNLIRTGASKALNTRPY